MWKRRELLGALGTGAAGLALFRTAMANSARDEREGKNAAMMKSCFDACNNCAEACNKAYHYCMEQASAGKVRHAKIAQTIADCAQFCGLSAALISRQSTLMAFSCRSCADACRRCAQECESFDTDVDIKLCFDSCQKCEESCREMVKAMGVS